MKHLLATLLVASCIAAPAAAGEMHPDVVLLDEAGVAIARSGGSPAATVSCGACHDTDYITAHDAHPAGSADCFDCHIEGGRAALCNEDGSPVMDPAALVTAPKSVLCGNCHGLVDFGDKALEISDELLRGSPVGAYAATLRTGEVFAPKKMDEAFVNLKDKAARTQSWDVHAARQLECSDCHFAANHPGKANLARKDGPRHLIDDPRGLDPGDYLRRPDHRLETAGCIDCHGALAAHPNLPYAERHVAVLDCESCHVPRLMAPAARAIDRTVLTPDGGPRMEYRGVLEAEWDHPNTWFTEGYRPFLLQENRGEESRFTPFNLTATWEWVDAVSGEPVGSEILERAWLDEAGGYRPELLRLLDADGDGELGTEELLLDTETKTAAVAARLVELGVARPAIAGALSAYPVRHGTAESEYVAADCNSCHATESRMSERILLTALPFPGGVSPEPDESMAHLAVRLVPGGEGEGLSVESIYDAKSHYVFGHERKRWTDLVGIALLALTALGVLSHAGLRYLSRRNAGVVPHAAPTERVYMYGQYERIWHWVMAVSVILLIVTGLQIHYPGGFELMSYPTAILAHNLLAAALILNSFLALFFHLATAEIGQFIPERAGLAKRLLLQIRFYLHGIFRGSAHPGRKTPEKKLNPLQQITYVGLLNVLFPLQILTGSLLWLAGWMPGLAKGMGGLAVVAPVHNLGSWLFLAFLLVHTYLTTTGHTVFSNLRAMTSGWESVETGIPSEAKS